MPLLPPLLLACFVFWSGTFPGAAAFPSAPVGQALVLAAALLGAAAWRDPLRLGGAGRWLLGALLAAVALSLWASPVARAGRVGVVLLPAFLLLAPFVARCWSTERRREIGLAAWSAVVAATAIWALAEQVRQASSRAAMPLGHHNLLAAFLVCTLPLVVPALRRRGAGRWLALLALAAGLAALVETRSFLGGAVLALMALAGAARFERARHLVLGLALLGLALLVPRAAAIVRGEDSSASARQVYLLAGWQGATERPIFGWGPGSTPWTLALHLRPLPGVNPSGEVVGEMHSLPLALAYELGFVGLALAAGIAGLFFCAGGAGAAQRPTVGSSRRDSPEWRASCSPRWAEPSSRSPPCRWLRRWRRVRRWRGNAERMSHAAQPLRGGRRRPFAPDRLHRLDLRRRGGRGPPAARSCAGAVRSSGASPHARPGGAADGTGDGARSAVCPLSRPVGVVGGGAGRRAGDCGDHGGARCAGGRCAVAARRSSGTRGRSEGPGSRGLGTRAGARPARRICGVSAGDARCRRSPPPTLSIAGRGRCSRNRASLQRPRGAGTRGCSARRSSASSTGRESTPAGGSRW